MNVDLTTDMRHKVYLNDKEMTAVINVFRVYEVKFRSGLMRAEVGNISSSERICSRLSSALDEGDEHAGAQPN